MYRMGMWICLVVLIILPIIHIGCSSGCEGEGDYPIAEMTIPVVVKLCPETSFFALGNQTTHSAECQFCSVVPVEIAYQEVQSKLQENGITVNAKDMKVRQALLTDLYLVVEERFLQSLKNINITLSVDTNSFVFTEPEFGSFTTIGQTAFRFQNEPIDITSTVRDTNQLCHHINISLSNVMRESNVPYEVKALIRLTIQARLPGKGYYFVRLGTLVVDEDPTL